MKSAEAEVVLQKTRETLEAIYGQPGVLAATKLAVAMAIDYLDQGNEEKAVEIIDELLRN
ncbi:MAG: hypothetical protein F4X48_05580 [Acidimicrobiia bacterium]|nr:hypothetical protein [Acidimicrobiia bacterium]MYC58031.1 hypothetical protein [Acidimicrobiia bacterium]MYI30796.1 hypothetical protein [Acidimicrobiia bacterium]